MDSVIYSKRGFDIRIYVLISLRFRYVSIYFEEFQLFIRTWAKFILLEIILGEEIAALYE